MVDRWKIQLLGGLEARQGQQVLTRFRTRKTGALLAFLALQGGRPVARDILFDALWPSNDLGHARNSLNVALSSLRGQLEAPSSVVGASPLGAILIADKNTVWLHPDAFVTDVAVFEGALRRARESDDSPDGWKTAVDAYTGSLLPGFYDDWVVTERDRLADAYWEALRALTARLIAARQPDAALDFAHRLVQADPLGEESRRLLMRVYADLGRAPDVRGQLAELERRRQEAGESPPTAETRWLVHRLAQNADPEKITTSLPTAEPAPRPDATRTATPSPLPGNLPLWLTRFFGRSEEIEAISDLLQTRRAPLVTITGSGGAGKTRLAIEVARRTTLPTAPGGAWFVPLADRTDPGQIVGAIRDALQLPRQADVDPLDQIAAHLDGQAALVILDNLEHLLGRGPADPSAAASVVRTLQRRLPALTLLATSRQALGTVGEIEFPLPLLPTPMEENLSPAALLEYPAVQLFVDRARQRRPDFAVTTRHAAALTQLLVRLEGIPLAIELAAAWAKLLAPAQMLDRMERRFDLLASQRSDLPARHRTLRAAIEWGYALLAPETQRLFDALSVFRGAWSAGDVEAVCNEEGEGRTLERLALLRDASLIRTDEGATEMRFSLLETLRQFADERLDDERRSLLERRHAERFLARAEAALQSSRGPAQQSAFASLEEDLPNLRIALERFVATPTGLRLAGALGYFWKIRGHYQEGRRWLERALTAADSTPEGTLARAWNAVGMLAEDQADYAAAGDAFERSRDIYQRIGDDQGAIIAIHNRGNVAYRQGDFVRAGALYTMALETYRSRDDANGVAAMLGSLANVAQEEGDLERADALQHECLQQAREIGNTRLVAYTLHNLGNLAAHRGQPDEARTYYAQSLPAKQALGDRRGVASLRTSLGILALESGRHDEALPHLQEALRELRELGNQLHLVTALETLGLHAYERGDMAHAALLWSAALAARERLLAPQSVPEREKYAPRAAAARTAAAADWDAGSQLSLEAAADCALAHTQAHSPSL